MSNLLNNTEIHVRVRCPRETAVEFQTGSADATVRGQVTSAHAKTGSGDMSFGEVVGELIVNAASGDVSAGDIGGDCTVKTASGDVRIHRVGGDFIGNLVSGDLHVAETQGDVNVSTVSGDQWIGSIAGSEVRLQAVSGDIRVGVRPGLRLWIDANSVSGDMSSELDAADGPPVDDGPGPAAREDRQRRRPHRTRRPDLADHGACCRRHPAFRNLWIGQTISVFGDQITMIALPLVAIVHARLGRARGRGPRRRRLAAAPCPLARRRGVDRPPCEQAPRARRG